MLDSQWHASEKEWREQVPVRGLEWPAWGLDRDIWGANRLLLRTEQTTHFHTNFSYLVRAVEMGECSLHRDE